MSNNDWIVIPLADDISKKRFSDFIYEKTGRRFTVGKQYRGGLVMQVVSVDLTRFAMSSITSAQAIRYKTCGIDDFLNKYEEFKLDYEKMCLGKI